MGCGNKNCNGRGFIVELIGGRIDVQHCPTCRPERMAETPERYYTIEQANDRVARAVSSHRGTIQELRAELEEERESVRRWNERHNELQDVANAELAAAQSELERHKQAAPLVLEYMKAADLLIDSATRDDIFVPPKQIGEQYERYIRAKDALAKALGVE